MVSKNTKQILSDEIGFRIYRLLRTHDFPLTQDVCLLALEEAFRKLGYRADFDDTNRKMNIGADLFFPTIGEGFSYYNSVTYDSILKGNGNVLPGSITSVDTATKVFFNKMERGLPSTCRNNLALNKYFRESFTLANNSTNIYIQNQIGERGDAILLNRMLQPSTFSYGSDLLENVLSRYDLEYYERAIQKKEEGESISEDVLQGVNRLISKPWSSFTEESLPSNHAFERFFWGVYLHDLHRLKGYDKEESQLPPAVAFVKFGEYQLKKADQISWGSIEPTKKGRGLHF